MRNITSTAAGLALMAALASCSDNDIAAPDAAPNEPEPDETSTSSMPPPPPECNVAGDYGVLSAGCWELKARGTKGPRVEFELPDGFQGSDAYVWLHPDPGKWQGLIAVSEAGNVYPDPCLHPKNAPTTGPTVEDFAAALVDQKVTTATKPAPVTFDGYDGLYLELSTPPAGFDFSKCRGEVLSYWDGKESPEAEESLQQPHRYWMFDVDGTRLVIWAFVSNAATDETVDLFTGIVESATFAAG